MSSSSPILVLLIPAAVWSGAAMWNAQNIQADVNNLRAEVQQDFLDRPVPVDCEEDEYLYFKDYKGPGDNTLGDLICVHMDSLG